MADTKKTKKKTTRLRTKSTVKKSAKRKPSRKSSAVTGEMLHHLSDTTRKQLRELGEKMSSAKERERLVIRDITDKVRQFANKATELTKIKIDIHNLKEEHKDLLKVMGENLWNMHKTGNVRNIRSKFRYDFQRLEELESALTKKENTVAEITKILKSIG